MNGYIRQTVGFTPNSDHDWRIRHAWRDDNGEVQLATMPVAGWLVLDEVDEETGERTGWREVVAAYCTGEGIVHAVSGGGAHSDDLRPAVVVGPGDDLPSGEEMLAELVKAERIERAIRERAQAAPA